MKNFQTISDIIFLQFNCFRANLICHKQSGTYTKKTNPKITILEILVYKIQPEIMKSKIFTRFNFITKPCSLVNMVVFLVVFCILKFPEWLFSD